MWSFRILQRSVRPHRTIRRSFSLTTFLQELVQKRSFYYPTKQIKDLKDFNKFASPEEKRHMERIQIEYLELCKSSLKDLPELSDEEWLIHMNYETMHGRTRHLNLLHTKQHKKTKQKRKDSNVEVKELHKLGHYHVYSRQKEKLILDNRVAQAMLVEDPIFVDLGFASSMFYNEITDVARHLVQALGSVNKSAFKLTPTLHVIFCNAKPSVEENEIIKVFRRFTVQEKSFDNLPVTITEKSYLDLYQDRELVYLTQDADLYYHPAEGIPVIGAIINKTTKNKLLLQKAYTDNIKARKLPIDLGEKVYDRRMTVAHIMEYVAMLRFTWDPLKARTTLQNRIVSPPMSQR